MLFQSQRDELTGGIISLYFAGAARLPNGRIAFVTGVRDKSLPKTITANVEYISKDGASTQQFNKSLSDVDFERFLNTFAMKTSTISNGSQKLTELDYHFPAFDDTKFNLNEQEKKQALFEFLSQQLSGSTRQEAARSAGSIIKHGLIQEV